MLSFYAKKIDFSEVRFFDEEVIEAAVNDEDQSEENINEEVKNLNKMGLNVVCDGENIKVKEESIFIERDENGFPVSSDLAKKLGQIQSYQKISKGMFGNNYNNMKEIYNAYKFFLKKDLLFNFSGISYKKGIHIRDLSIPIRKILFDTDVPIDTEFLKKENQFVNESTFIGRLISILFEMPNVLSNVGMMDIERFENILHSMGYIHAKVLGKTIFLQNTLGSPTGAVILYTIKCGKKFKLNKVIVESNYLYNTKKIANFIKNVLISSNYYSLNKKAMDEITQTIGLKCLNLDIVAQPGNMFNLIVNCEELDEEEIITDLIFKNFPIKTSTLFRMAKNNGLIVGEALNEKSIQKTMGVLNTFLGEQPQFNRDKGLVLFSFSKCPSGWRWSTSGLQQSIVKLDQTGLTVTPGRYYQFAIKQKLFYYFIEPNLYFPGKDPKTWSLSPSIHSEYITKDNWKFSIMSSFPFSLAKVGNNIFKLVKKKFSSAYEKLSNDVFNKELYAFWDVFSPQLGVRAEKTLKSSSYSFGVKYNNSKESHLFHSNLKSSVKNLNKRLNMQDQMILLSEDNFLNLFNLSLDGKKILNDFKNNRSSIECNNQFIVGFNRNVIQGIKLTPRYDKMLKIGDDQFIFSLIGAWSLLNQTLSNYHSQSEIRTIFAKKEHFSFIDKAIVMRAFLVHELIDSTPFIGAKLVSLSYGAFLNGAILNYCHLGNLIDTKKDNFMNLVKQMDNHFKLGFIISFGFIITIDVMGLFCLYIAIGVDLLNGKIKWETGAITDYNKKALENIMNVTR